MGKLKRCLWLPILLLVPLSVFCQNRQISGRVLGPNNEPVPAATIFVKGTKTGVAANESGRFTITVPSSNAVLVISAVGFTEQEVQIGSANEYSISLTNANDLSEVVVTAFGIKKEKKALGYAAQEVKGADLVASRQTNIVNALRGKVAGVQINSGGGAPGQGSRIIIRGIKSLSPGKDNQPLFVIDGIIMDNSTVVETEKTEPRFSQPQLRGLSNRAADINPDDVESISVLRGGAATALYGQAGSNGVVVITTRSAKAGKMMVNFSSTVGIDEVNKYPDVQRKFSQGNNGVYNRNDFFPSFGPTIEAAKALDSSHPDQIYHHYKQGYQQGNQSRASINLSGGTENALLTSSFSYFKQNGTIPNSDYKNISARLGGQFKLGSKLKINPSFYFINSGGLRVNADRYNESLSYWSPRHNVKDFINPNGTMKTYGTQNNPIYATFTNRFRDNVNRIIGNVNLSYSILKWLNLDYRLGMDYYSDFRRQAAPGPLGIVGEIRHGDNALGFVDEYRISNRILNSNVMATINKDWTDKFNTVLRVGNEVRALRYSRLTAKGSELDVPDLLTINNSKVRSTNQYEEQYRIVSAYGDLSFGWDDFLFLNITGRNDWSSSLAPGNNSFFYPSASLSYVFSDHFQVPNWLNFGKFRVSLAEIGKDTKPYEINTYYNSSVLTSSTQVIWTRGDVKGDATLKPERTTTFEVGTELRALNNRLSLDLTWYKLNSRDQIIPVSVSTTSGFTGFIINAGEIENKGIEVVLSGSVVKSKNFTWDATVNFSRNRNKVVSLREGLSEIVVESDFGYVGGGATLKYAPGYAVGNIYGTAYRRYGVKDDDLVTLYRDKPIVILSTGSNRGFPEREPVSSQRILGNSQPDWIGGFNNTLSFKAFTLSFLWETHQGQDRYNGLGNFMSAFGIAKYTENRTESIVFDGVLADGSKNTQLVFLGQGTGPDGRDYSAGFYRNVHRGVTENFVEDASWVRLRNLSLSYNVPASVLQKTIIKGAAVTLTGNNMFLFTDFSGYDPESSARNSGSNADGFASLTYPQSRSYLITLNLNF